MRKRFPPPPEPESDPLADIHSVLSALNSIHVVEEASKGAQPQLPISAPCICGRNSGGSEACAGLRRVIELLGYSLLNHYQGHPRCNCDWAARADKVAYQVLGYSPRAHWKRLQRRKRS